MEARLSESTTLAQALDLCVGVVQAAEEASRSWRSRIRCRASALKSTAMRRPSATSAATALSVGATPRMPKVPSKVRRGRVSQASSSGSAGEAKVSRATRSTWCQEEASRGGADAGSDVGAGGKTRLWDATGAPPQEANGVAIVVGERRIGRAEAHEIAGDGQQRFHHLARPRRASQLPLQRRQAAVAADRRQRPRCSRPRSASAEARPPRSVPCAPHYRHRRGLRWRRGWRAWFTDLRHGRRAA